MGRHRRHAVASSALVAALVAVAGVASVARGATPVVPSASSVRVVAGSRATLTLAGTDSDDTHTLSALITSLPGTGSVYKDDQNTALDAAANYCTALASGTVSARRLAGVADGVLRSTVRRDGDETRVHDDDNVSIDR